MSDYNVTEPTPEEIAEVFEQDKVKPKTKYFEEFEPQWADTSVGAWLDFYIQHFREHFKSQSPQAQASKYFRASTFGRCPRRALLQRAGVEELRQPDKTAWRRFQWGDDIEWFTVRRLEALGVLIETQVAIEDEELELTCHVDAVVGGWIQKLAEIAPEGENPAWWAFQKDVRQAFADQAFDRNNWPVIGLEIKSAPSYSMKRAYKHGPRGDNMMQVAAQNLLAERHPEAFKKAPDAWQLLMVGKDAVGFLEFQVTDDWKQAALKRVDELREAWHEGTWIRCTCGGKHNPGLPAKEAKQRAWEIDYCAFRVGPEGSGICCADDLEAVYRERRAGE